MGKILVVNTLVASQCIYQFTALPSLTLPFFDNVRKWIVKFLWDFKLSKLKYSKVVLDVPQAGLKLSDILIKDASLKAAWVKRATNLPKTGFSLYYSLPWKSDLIWACNISKKDICKEFQGSDSMGMQVWLAWTDFSYYRPKGKEDILQQIIWLNSHIKIANKCCFNQAAIDAGLIYIRDSFGVHEKNFVTWYKIKERFGTAIDLVTYNGGVNALPKI